MIMVDRDEARARAIDDHTHAPEQCTPELAGLVINRAEGERGAELEEDVRAYFAQFAAPLRRLGDDGKSLGLECFHCGADLTGFSAVMFGGGFEWGLTHGEGRCSTCHWPARAYHFAKDRHGEELFTLRNVVLLYHPDGVTKAEPAALTEAARTEEAA